jgi:hypothetical protein
VRPPSCLEVGDAAVRSFLMPSRDCETSSVDNDDKSYADSVRTVGERIGGDKYLCLVKVI